MTATEVSDGVRSDSWRWASAELPYIYEINTWPWLNQLSVEAGRPVDLSTVPDERWAALADAGFDAVWLMGVWARSPAGSAIALDNKELVESFQAVLPDYQPQDVVGSPYCVRDYQVDPRLGGRDGLARARAALARHGLGLILDFVPNHVAPDHPWTRTNPELFVRGSSQELEDDPGSFVAIDGSVLARGRDPYFPAWPDVVQLNAFAPALRDTVIATLRDIAEQCDGVRCDMAMLMMNDVFARTWGARVGAPPAQDYWPTVIPAVRDDASRLPLHRRGLLGSRVGAATAGLRLLLRQAPLRPPRGRRGGADPGPLVRGPAVSAAAGPVHREPRRAAGRRGVRRASATGRGGDEP